MIEFFSKIGDLLSIGVSFVINGIRNLAMLLFMIPKAFAALVETLYLFPQFISIPMLAVISIALTIAIINKFGG